MRSGSLGIDPRRVSAKFGEDSTSRTAGRCVAPSPVKKVLDESGSVEPLLGRSFSGLNVPQLL